MRRRVVIGVTLALLLAAGPACPYPVDGGDVTGIARLDGYRRDQARLPQGARLPLDQVDLRLVDRDALALPPVDPDFLRQLLALLGDEADRYALAVLDLSDPNRPRYAEHRGEVNHNPGSVGKLLIALGVFQALADLYPDDLGARTRVLRETQVTADAFILSDHHKVPFWNPHSGRLTFRTLAVGDRASLWSCLDWMLSASSNAAASMVLRELLLLKHFGRDYPVAQVAEESFWKNTPKRELTALLAGVLEDPVPRNGLELDQLRQGGFFTWKGKQLVPGTSSHASPRMLMQYLLRMEQGKLVDTFSSREIKRLLYMTERRIRYASSPALADAAVYFKSGSLYRCQPEPGFVCRKYEGNVDNQLNSVAIVESPAQERRLYYLVVVMSNVLKKNSAVAHQTLATRVHRLIEVSYRSGR
jgi:Beta-lactamase enzyme family